jgi:hypothetical protein
MGKYPSSAWIFTHVAPVEFPLMLLSVKESFHRNIKKKKKGNKRA